MTAGTIPIRASTEGSERIPNDMVSAIMTSARQQSQCLPCFIFWELY